MTSYSQVKVELHFTERNFVVGGKLGDFIHSLFMIKNICKQNNNKANIYLVDIGWERGIETTLNEIKDILLRQDYINSVSILTEYELDPVQTSKVNTPIKVFNEKLIREGFVDMGDYIRSPWLYRVCWSELLANTFNFKIPDVYQWIDYDDVDPELVDKILIFRRYNPIRLNDIFPFEKIIEQYGKDNILFVAFDEIDYQNFPFKDMITFKKLHTLNDLFKSIHSSRFVVSNLSSPTTVAHALDKLRIIELPTTPDAIHCIGEEKYSRNVFWFLDYNINNLGLRQ